MIARLNHLMIIEPQCISNRISSSVLLERAGKGACGAMDKWQACPVTGRAGSEGAKPQPELATKGLEEAHDKHVTNVTENTIASSQMLPHRFNRHASSPLCFVTMPVRACVVFLARYLQVPVA